MDYWRTLFDRSRLPTRPTHRIAPILPAPPYVPPPPPPPPPPPSAVLVTPPLIGGTRGGTLTATPAVWTGATSVSRQWFADGTGTGNTMLVYTDSNTAATLEYRETALSGPVTASAWEATVANAVTINWSSTDITSGMALSGNNLTATIPSGGQQGVRASAAPAGNEYAEYLIVAASGVIALGVSDTTTFTNFLGQGDNFSAAFRSDGEITHDSSEGAGGFTFTTGDRVKTYYDRTAKKLYGGKVGSGWLVGDPAAGTGGLPVSGATGEVRAAFMGVFGLPAVTANFGASAFFDTPPSGADLSQGTSALVTVNPQSSGAAGKYQIDVTVSTNVSGATGLQFKIETTAGVLLQTWTTLPFSGGSGSGTYLIPGFAYEGQQLRVLGRNVGGTASIVSALSSTIPYDLQQSMKIGLNDTFWNYWSFQLPGRDIFESITHNPSDSMDLISTDHAISHDAGLLPPGHTFLNYAHWDEAYDPAQTYPATTSTSDDNYMVCVVNGVQWRRTVRVPRSGVAPDPTDGTGAVSGWTRYNIALGSVVGMDARGMPTMLPADTNLTIRFTAPWAFPTARYPVTVHCKTEPGVKIDLMAPVNVTQTNINLGAGTFDLVYTGDTQTKFVIDRSAGAISSAFFLSGVPAYETGTPSTDIGAPYVGADKLSDFAPLYAMRNMSGQPTNRSWLGVHNGMTAANSVPTGGRRLWKYNVDMAVQNNHQAIWVNVQDVADDTYMDAMAAYYLANLPVGTTVYLELGNERWNGANAFHQGVELIARATAAGLATHEMHAREHKAMVLRWRAVWGAQAARVKGVVNWQFVASLATWGALLDFESAYTTVDYIAGATYWGTEGYADYASSTHAPVVANDYPAFETAIDAMMRGMADAVTAQIKAFYSWLPSYSVGKGLNKNAIKWASYEGGPQLLVNDPGTWDAALGAGTGARALAFVRLYKRSAAMGATYSYWLDKLALQVPHTYMAFDYAGVAEGWSHVGRTGNQSDQPYAALKAKALTYN